MATYTPCGHRDTDLSSEDGLRRAALTYGPELRAYASRRLRNCTLAEDLVQETFLRAWRASELFDETRGTTRAWLFAILRNVIVDFARARARRPHTSTIRRDTEATDDADAVVRSLAVHDALRHLTVKHREVIYHGHLRERSHKEIAKILGVPIGTVRSRLFYARQALRHALTDSG
jgi:RNA polymerase sigma-70 factor (ECF subfamily)